MILDKQNAFSDAQAVTVTAASTNVIDVGHAKDWMAGAEQLEIVVQVALAVTASGSATVTFALQTDTASTFGSATAIATTSAIGKATLVAGYQAAHWRFPVSTAERYLRVYYTVASGPLLTGAFSAFIVREGQTNRNGV